MAKNYSQIAEDVLSKVGGAENVASNMACMTRLRLTLKDTSKVDADALKTVDGVMGLVEAGERIEVVLGPGTVNKVLEEFAKLTGIKPGEVSASDGASAATSVVDAAASNKASQNAKHDKPVQRFLKRIANIFVPLLPGIIAAGLINGIANVIDVSSGHAFAAIWWYQAIRTMGWALFFYLPLLVGMNAAKEFGGSAVLGAMAGGLSIANVAMPMLAKSTDGAALVHLPFSLPSPAFTDAGFVVNFSTVYNPAAGGLLGALICGIFFAFLEKNFRKIIPAMLDTFLTPLFTVIVGSIVAVIVLQPVGAFLTQGVFFVIMFIYEKLGFVGGYLLSALFLPLVSVGLHQALVPIHAMLNLPDGPTHGINYLFPILMVAGGGQVGAGIALYLKTKNERVRGFLRESIPVGFLGVGEPLMYAVTLPLGKPFVTACLGAGFGGILAWIFHLGAVSQGVSGLFGLLIMEPGTQLQYVIAMLVAYAGGFILTYFFGVDEDRINDVFGA